MYSQGVEIYAFKGYDDDMFKITLKGFIITFSVIIVFFLLLSGYTLIID